MLVLNSVSLRSRFRHTSRWTFTNVRTWLTGFVFPNSWTMLNPLMPSQSEAGPYHFIWGATCCIRFGHHSNHLVAWRQRVPLSCVLNFVEAWIRRDRCLLDVTSGRSCCGVVAGINGAHLTRKAGSFVQPLWSAGHTWHESLDEDRARTMVSNTPKTLGPANTLQ